MPSPSHRHEPPSTFPATAAAPPSVPSPSPVEQDPVMQAFQESHEHQRPLSLTEHVLLASAVAVLLGGGWWAVNSVRVWLFGAS